MSLYNLLDISNPAPVASVVYSGVLGRQLHSGGGRKDKQTGVKKLSTACGSSGGQHEDSTELHLKLRLPPPLWWAESLCFSIIRVL